jgi:hypothetical protein
LPASTAQQIRAIFVGERHDNDVLVLTGQQASQPAPDRRVSLGEPLEDRPCAVDEVLAQVAIAALADAKGSRGLPPVVA